MYDKAQALASLEFQVQRKRTLTAAAAAAAILGPDLQLRLKSLSD